MRRQFEFSVTYAPETIDHLHAIDLKHHRALRRAIEESLGWNPIEPTRNRKPLEEPTPFSATWELRCGPMNRFRVFYEVNLEERTVSVLAIGVKEGNRLFVAGEEVEP
jgi:mRNA-degrading endonuclease RelE of RelBE toxin-antitoxin system